MLKNKVKLLSLILLTPNIVQAEENLWVYTKGTDTRPKGSTEAKISNIIRADKGSGHYTFQDIRPEVEYGVTDRLTIGGELMIFDHDYSIDGEIGPMNETQEAEGDGRFNETKFGGYELAMKYNVLSPYIDPIGLSLGLAYEKRYQYRLDGADINQDSYVGLVFLQKNWFDATLTLAANFKVELERRDSADASVLEEEIAIDNSIGLSYRFKPKHFAGIELRHQADYVHPSENGIKEDGYKSSNWDLTDIQIGVNHQQAIYFGPTYHYAEKNWWVTSGILFQIYGDGNDEHGAFTYENKTYDEHERYHIGLFYGYEF